MSIILPFPAPAQSLCVSADFPAIGVRDRHLGNQNAGKPCREVVFRLAFSPAPPHEIADPTEQQASATIRCFVGTASSGRAGALLPRTARQQASCYVHAVQERFDEPVSLRYVVLVKTKKPAVQYLTTARCESDLDRLGDIVQAVEHAIQAEAFYPIESPMTCSGCAFYKQCREWKGCSSTQRWAQGR
jgi:hypothetical protein